MPVTELAEGEFTHRWPQIVPGGKGLVYTAHSGSTGFDAATIKVKSLIDGKTKTIHQGGTAGRVVKTSRGRSYLLYVSRGALFAKPFDLEKLDVIGGAVPVFDGMAPLLQVPWNWTFPAKARWFIARQRVDCLRFMDGRYRKSEPLVS